MQERRNSIANAPELRLSCTTLNPTCHVRATVTYFNDNISTTEYSKTNYSPMQLRLCCYRWHQGMGSRNDNLVWVHLCNHSLRDTISLHLFDNISPQRRGLRNPPSVGNVASSLLSAEIWQTQFINAPRQELPRQSGRHIADDICKCILFNENVFVLIKISLKFVYKGLINDMSMLIHTTSLS